MIREAWLPLMGVSNTRTRLLPSATNRRTFGSKAAPDGGFRKSLVFLNELGGIVLVAKSGGPSTTSAAGSFEGLLPSRSDRNRSTRLFPASDTHKFPKASKASPLRK